MQFRLFGDIAVVADGASTSLGGGRSAVVLAVLLTDPGRPVSVDRLADEIWGEALPSDVAHTVRVTVSRLRTALVDAGAGDVVRTTPGGYVADVARSDVDTARFMDLVATARSTAMDADRIRLTAEALELWTGTPFGPMGDVPMLDLTRHTLVEARGEALDLWAGAANREGLHADVITALEPAMDDYPYREHLWLHLATALYHDGRQVEAMRALQRARDTLAETGMDVGPDFASMEAHVISGSLAGPSPASSTGNIPAPVDSFIGRTEEIAEIGARFSATRLVTLVGPGGSGKTRLATEYGRDDYGARSSWLVDLAGVTDPEGVADAIVATLGVGQHLVTGSLDGIVRHIGDSHTLIILDNVEHLIDATARTVDALLARCPALRILTTSREPLRTGGETVVVVRSLAVPRDADGTEAPDAVRLFIDRATAAIGGGKLSAQDLDDVADIVTMLDGIPLAIELAAVRTRTLPIAEIASRMDDILSTLGAGPRTALPRHRTLRAAIEWSVSLLSDEERTLFLGLGVLMPTFGFDAVSAVSDFDAGTTETAIDGLVEKSMVQRVDVDGRRYRVLEPLRQYAEAALSDEGGRAGAVDRRDAHFRALMDEAAIGRRKEDPDWQRRIRPERPNLIASAESLLVRDPQAGAAMVDAMAGYWMSFGLYPEGRRLVAAALAADGIPIELRLSLATIGGMLAVHQGDYAAVEREMASTLTAAEDHGLDPERAAAMNVMGSLHAERGDMRRATEWLESALALLDGPAVAPSSVNLGAVSGWSGNPQRARDLADAADAAVRESADIDISAYTAAVRAIAARMEGDLSKAAVLADAARAGFEERRSEFHIGVAQIERAVAAIESGETAEASAICDEVLRIDDHGNAPLLPRIRARLVRARLAVDDARLVDATADLAHALDEATESSTEWGVVEAAEIAAEIAMRNGDPAAARSLVAGASAVRERLGLARDPWERERIARIVGPPEATADIEDIGALAAAVTATLRGS